LDQGAGENMKRPFFIFLLFILFCSVASAEYKENMILGNQAYKRGDLEKAMTYYNKALAENPNEQLSTFTFQLQKKINEMNEKSEKNNGNGFYGVILTGADLLLSSYAVAAYMNYSASADSYEKLYTSINGTSNADTQILNFQKKQVEQKGTLMAFACGAAGVAVSYTVLDLLVFHNAFYTRVAAQIDPLSGYAGIKAQWRM
jgi:tetratricopeptide (TPR) repeat protein